MEPYGVSLSSLLDVGFFRTDALKHLFSPFEGYFEDIDVIQQIPEIMPQQPGYSALLDINSLPGLHDTCLSAANTVIQWLPKGYIFRPRFLGACLMKSMFCAETHASGATRAFLWHRDNDDLFSPMIKVMVPMVSVSRENGMFSALQNQVCSLDQKFLDNSTDSDTSFVDQNDALGRVRDDVMRRHFGKYIVDFDASPSEAFVVDTSSVYHRGGMILSEDKFRINIQLIIGSSLNSINQSRPRARTLLRRISKSIPTGFGHNIHYKKVMSRSRNQITLN